MKLQLNIEKSDYTAFCLAVTRRASAQRRSNGPWSRIADFLIWLLLLVAAIRAFQVARRYGLQPAQLISAAAFGAVVLGGTFAYFLLSAMKAMTPRANGSILGTKTLSVTSEGLHEVSQGVEVTARWAAIDLEETKDHVFLHFDNCAAIIVPKRSFESAAACAEFLSLVQQWTEEFKENAEGR